MSVIEADWLQTAYASSRRPRVATRLAPTVRAPEMRLRSESLTGPRGAATGRRDPVASSARHDLCGCSQAYHRRPFAPHDQLIQPPALLSLGRCSRSGVPDHVGRPGIVVQTPQLKHNLPRRDGGGAAGRFKPKRYVRAPDAARPHPEADGVRRVCPEFAAPPRMTGLSAPRLGEARALLGTARPRRCLTAAAVRGWAGTSRCRGTPATAGAAGGAGRTRSHDAARPWVRQCARRLLQWGQSLTARPARGARRAPRPRPARPGHRRPRRTPRGRTTRRRAAPTRPAGPATDPGQAAHPAVPGTRGPLATDLGQRRPLGQRQAVPPGRHPAGHRSSVPAIEHSFAQEPIQRLCLGGHPQLLPLHRRRPTGGVAREELARVAPRALAKADQRRFLRAVEGCPSARDRAIATVFFYTGLR